MYALTLQQPFATFVALGIKEFETRNWYTHYRGPLLIHAGVTPVKRQGKILIKQLSEKFRPIGNLLLPITEYPIAAIVCKCELVDCIPTTSFTPNNLERMTGWWEQSYAWKLEEVQPLFIPQVLGKQGLWKFPDEEVLKYSENAHFVGANS
ncbi:hypothetical protein PCC9214_05367 [Planktothrix tepida]|uniref:Uncharacterized protein n=1 Tax=Planktothrix tepida PCC 9214 TaxID=671072 RepID=A0A1J1LI08_9CYAN|nr:ASCH domain-containing protein [Planktothrix tepida]CAD5985011.1 hypothetical protein PCC9214_05329 [Planktothrix tepida]CAD5985291.1 hypothetical protein PCC9214_05367 [Planktothrix tepida]CUR32123.1 conserved hypothetical protein [Planktothrix tepida PCC 9214]